MKIATITLAFLLILLFGFAYEISAHGDDAADAHVYTSTSQLRAAASPVMMPNTTSTHPPFPSDKFIWLAGYLGNPNKDLRDAAAEIVARGPQPLSELDYEKYLSADHPINVRMAALIRVMEFYTNPSSKRHEEIIRTNDDIMALTTQPFHEVVNYPVSPPFFNLLARLNGIYPDHGMQKEDYQLYAHRLLACHRSGDSEMLNGFGNFPVDLEMKYIIEWYMIEPDPAVRIRTLWVLNKPIPSYSPQLAALAQKDWVAACVFLATAKRWGDKYVEPAETKLAIKTAEQLNEGYRGLTNAPADDPKTKTAIDGLLAYLDSDRPSLRLAAASLLINTRLNPTSQPSQYLDLKHPLEARVAALIVCFRSNPHPTVLDKAEWSKVFNDALACPVVPPFMKEMLLSSPYPLSDAKWFDPSNVPMTIRRVYRLLRLCDEEQAGRLLGLLKALDADPVIREAVEYYRIEPEPAVRRLVLQHPPVGDMAKFKPVLEIAAQDWDDQNKSLAEETLKKLKP